MGAGSQVSDSDFDIIQITSDGTARGTKVYANGGEIIPVRSIIISADYEKVAIELEVAVVEAKMLSGDVTWVGLEHVPRQALEQELEKRIDDGD